MSIYHSQHSIWLFIDALKRELYLDRIYPLNTDTKSVLDELHTLKEAPSVANQIINFSDLSAQYMSIYGCSEARVV